MVPIHAEPLVLLHRIDHPSSMTHDLATLLESPLAVPSRYFNENRLFASIMAATGGLVVPRYRLNSLSSCLNLAGTSDVITIAPLSVAERAVQQPQEYGLMIAAEQLDLNIRLALFTVASNALTPAVRAFQEALVSR